jgi:hypothetical protein
MITKFSCGKDFINVDLPLPLVPIGSITSNFVLNPKASYTLLANSGLESNNSSICLCLLILSANFKSILTLGNIKGFQLDKNEITEFKKAIFTVDEQGLTPIQKTYMQLSIEEKLAVDYLIYKKLGVNGIFKGNNSKSLSGLKKPNNQQQQQQHTNAPAPCARARTAGSPRRRRGPAAARRPDPSAGS